MTTLNITLTIAQGPRWPAGSAVLSSKDYTMVSATDLVLEHHGMVYLNAAAQIAALPLNLPVPVADSEIIDVYFAQRVNALEVKVSGQDRPGVGEELQDIVKSTVGLPTVIQAGTTLRFKYTRSLTQWRCQGVWSAENPVDVVDPTRDFGASLNGATVITSQILAAMSLAKKAAPAGMSYGLGGKVRLQVGVALSGPLPGWSRWVSLDGSGALGSSVIRSDYSSLAGVPGEDAQITFADDGSGQAGIVGQNKMHNFAIDGRRSTIEAVGNALRGHVRHGIKLPDPTTGTDRVFSAGDLQIMNMPGDGLHIEKNDQIRGGNLKFTGNRRGVYFDRVKDGKIDQLGSGSNGPRMRDGDTVIVNDQIDDADLLASNVWDNCASLKVGKVDFWTGPTSGAIPLLLIRSCAKIVIGEGECEGMVVFQGDNADDASKSYRQALMNTAQSINFKVSVDMHDAYVAAGIAANVTTGAGYVAHVKVIDANGIRLPNCSLSYKLGQPADGEGDRLRYIAATPPVGFWFGTSIPTDDPQYDDWLEACGDLDITGATLTWWEGKGTPGKRSLPVYGFKEHIANLPGKLRGLRLGHIVWRPAGTQQQDEIALDGSTYTSDYYGLLYLRLDPNWAATPTRKLTDRDPTGPGADPVTGYVTFTVPNVTPAGGLTAYMVYTQ